MELNFIDNDNRFLLSVNKSIKIVNRKKIFTTFKIVKETNNSTIFLIIKDEKDNTIKSLEIISENGFDRKVSSNKKTRKFKLGKTFLRKIYSDFINISNCVLFSLLIKKEIQKLNSLNDKIILSRFSLENSISIKNNNLIDALSLFLNFINIGINYLLEYYRNNLSQSVDGSLNFLINFIKQNTKLNVYSILNKNESYFIYLLLNTNIEEIDKVYSEMSKNEIIEIDSKCFMSSFLLNKICSNSSLVELFIENGFYMNNIRVSLMDVIIKYNLENFCKYIVRKYPHIVNKKNFENQLPLMVAIENNNKRSKIVDILLSRTDINKKCDSNSDKTIFISVIQNSDSFYIRKFIINMIKFELKKQIILLTTIAYFLKNKEGGNMYKLIKDYNYINQGSHAIKFLKPSILILENNVKLLKNENKNKYEKNIAIDIGYDIMESILTNSIDDNNIEIFNEIFNCIELEKIFNSKICNNEKTMAFIYKNIKNPYFLLQKFCTEGNLKELKFLIQVNPNIDINEKNEDGNTVLMVSLKNEHFDIARELLNNELINVNIINSHGYDPLFYMIKKSYHEEDIFKSIMNKYEDINKINPIKKSTPLVYAIQKKRYFFVNLLLKDKNVKTNIKDSEDKTPVQHALKTKKSKIIKLLLFRDDNKENVKSETKLNDNGDLQEIKTTCEGKDNQKNLINKQQIKGLNDENQQKEHLKVSNQEMKMLNREDDGQQKEGLSDNDNKLFMKLLSEEKYDDAKELIKEGKIDVNLENVQNLTPLNYLLESKLYNEDVKSLCYLLIDKEAAIDVKYFDQSHPSFELLIEKMNIINYLINKSSFNIIINNLTKKVSIQYIFLKAIKKGNVKLVESIINNGMDVNCLLKKSLTPLLYALKSKQNEIVNLLLEKDDIDVNKADSEGVTPLLYCIFHNELHYFKMLIKRKDIDMHIKYKECSYKDYAKNNETMKKLIERKEIDIEKVDLLMKNIKNSNAAKVDDILKKMNDIEKIIVFRQEDNDHFTPLLSAISVRTPNKKINEKGVISLLCENNVDINHENSLGLTPLLLAIEKNDLRMIEYLIDHQVDINQSNMNNVTPFSKALDSSNIKILELLLKNKVKIPIENKDLAEEMVIQIEKRNLLGAKFIFNNQDKDLDSIRKGLMQIRLRRFLNFKYISN